MRGAEHAEEALNAGTNAWLHSRHSFCERQSFCMT